MIRLIPLEDEKRLQELCKQCNVAYGPHVHAYVSAQSDLKAMCIFSLEKYTLELLALEAPTTDPLLPELFIRAVASYGANRSGYLLRVSTALGNPIQTTLKTLNFELTPTGYLGKVPKVLEGTCHCKK